MSSSVILQELKFCIEQVIDGKTQTVRPLRKFWKIFPDQKSFQFGFVCPAPGEHSVRIKFDWKHISGSPYEHCVTPDENNNPEPSMAELESELEDAIRDLYIEVGLSPPDDYRPGPSQDISISSSSSSDDSMIMELSPSTLKALKEKEERRSNSIPVERKRL